MTYKEAKRIYKYPQGHSKRDIEQSRQILNSQTIELTESQFNSILTAYKSLGLVQGIVRDNRTLSLCSNS